MIYNFKFYIYISWSQALEEEECFQKAFLFIKKTRASVARGPSWAKPVKPLWIVMGITQALAPLIPKRTRTKLTWPISSHTLTFKMDGSDELCLFSKKLGINGAIKKGWNYILTIFEKSKMNNAIFSCFKLLRLQGSF